jgi:imidazolonepropionase-like amidohydrolase
MKKYLVTAVLTASLSAGITQNSSISFVDSGSFFLHKFAQNIGRETYTVTKQGNTVQYDINFRFVDRGSAVPLMAQIVTSPSLEPVSFFIKGSTSRFSTINDSIHIANKQASIRVDDSIYHQPMKPFAFPVGGYSPGTVQMLLLQYWKKNKEPKNIPLLPTGEVSISRQGIDTISFNGQVLGLERYVIGGLVWGNEIVWTDKNLHLVCLITNDAEGDKLEMMQEQYENLLPELLTRAAKYGMEMFSSSMKMNTTNKDVLVITGGNLVDVENGNSMSNAVIIIEKGIIKQIGKVGSVTIPANAKIIHAEGKTILPGLWDMHSHFEQAEWGPAYLAAGVTTVRDCGNEFGYINAVKSAIDGRKGIGPEILKAGIIDGPGSKGLGVIRAATPEEAIQDVQLYKNNGFAQIKIYSSVKPAIVKAICDEAHRLGLTVTGHIPSNMTIQQGVDSGMDGVNHIQYVYAAMKKNKDQSVNMDDPMSIATLNFLKEHNTVIDATVGVFEMAFRNVKDNITDMEPAFYSLPLPLQTLFKNTGMPEAQAKVYKPVYEAMKNLVKALYDKGIIVVAGTDMGFPGYSVDRELELYVDAGLTPLQAIQSATIVPARVMKMDQQTGSIKEGKRADLILIDGDPLVQIRNIRRVSVVIKDGQQYDPVVLHKMVGFTK